MTHSDLLSSSWGESLNLQINRLGLLSVGVLIVTTVVTALFPLDAPDGYTASHADRVAWLVEHRGSFILGWLNQILAMLSLSAALFAIAWQIRAANVLRALLATTTLVLSVMAFLIPKFIAVWTIPQLADTSTLESTHNTMANTLLLLLNVSVPYSLFTSFDYLGFWLYAVFALLVAVPLYAQTLASKVASVTLGVFGVTYHVLLGVMLWGALPSTDIEAWFIGVSALLLLVVVAMGFEFRRAPQA